jgi:hypothetical protein
LCGSRIALARDWGGIVAWLVSPALDTGTVPDQVLPEEVRIKGTRHPPGLLAGIALDFNTFQAHGATNRSDLQVRILACVSMVHECHPRKIINVPMLAYGNEAGWNQNRITLVIAFSALHPEFLVGSL